MHTRILLAAVPLLAWGACSQPSATDAAAMEATNMTVRLEISGMT
jgi:hypothetical protein